METFNEKEFVESLEEFFNEEDMSVGLYAIGKIDKEVVRLLEESFEGIEVVTYNKDEVEVKVNGDLYVVQNSSSYERWRVYRQINL